MLHHYRESYRRMDAPCLKHQDVWIPYFSKVFEKVVKFMDSYSISQEDLDLMMAMSKFQGHSSPLDGVQPTVKDALTKAYNKDSKSRAIQAVDDAAWEDGDAAGHSGYTIIEADYIGYVGLCLILDLDYDYK
ncbi:replication factor C subunit 1, partial [Tanacetum coccineum]